MKIIYRGFTYDSNQTPSVSIKPSVGNWCYPISSQEATIVSEQQLDSSENLAPNWRYQLLLANYCQVGTTQN